MGKKGTKRKTQWRTLSITEQDEINAAAGITSKGNYSNGINTDEASSVDDNFKYSGTNYSYLKRKASSLSSSSNQNNNYNINLNKNRNDYRNSTYNNSYKQYQHNNSSTLNNNGTTTTNINDHPNNNPHNDTTAAATTTTTTTTTAHTYNRFNNNTNFNSNYHYNNYTSRYSYRRRQYSMQQNGGIGTQTSSSSSYSTRYNSNYNDGRGYNNNRSNSSIRPVTTTSSNKENNDYERPTFNEDEYTRITTPRQDVIFKKGYFSRPRPYLSSTDTNTTSSAAASIVSNEESMSATSVPSSLSPEQCSSSQSDSITDQEHAYMYSYVDQNGIVYVNPYMPNGFDQYTGQMFVMPYGYSPYSVCPPGGLNTPPLNDDEIEAEIEGEILEEAETSIENPDEFHSVIADSDEKNSENLSNHVENEPTTTEGDTLVETLMDNSIEGPSKLEETPIEPKIPLDSNLDVKVNYDKYPNSNLENHCQQQSFINYGFGAQFYPAPLYYPLNMFNHGQPLMPVIGSGGYNIHNNIHNEIDDADESDQSINCTNTNLNRSHRDLQSDKHSTPCATTTDESDDSSELDEITKTTSNQEVGSEMLPNEMIVQNQTLPSETDKCDTNKLNDDIERSPLTQETEIQQQPTFNADVEEFKPRTVEVNIKPHLNVNVKEFLPRSLIIGSPLASPSPPTEKSEMFEKKSINNVSAEQPKVPQNANSLSPKTPTSTKFIIQVSDSRNIKIHQDKKPQPKLNTITTLDRKLDEPITDKLIKTKPVSKSIEEPLPTAATKKNGIRKNSLASSTRKSTKSSNRRLPTNNNEVPLYSRSVSTPTTIVTAKPVNENSIQQQPDVLSYAQMVNKDLIMSDTLKKSSKATSQPNDINKSDNGITDNDDDFNIEAIVKSIEAADNLSASKANITWQKVKPRGKRGKNFKEQDDVEDDVIIQEKNQELENKNRHDEIPIGRRQRTTSATEVHHHQKSPILVDNKIEIVAAPAVVDIEETTEAEIEVETETEKPVALLIPEKKKTRSRNKKSSKKSSNTLKKSKNPDEKIHEIAEKTEKSEDDAKILVEKIFEEIDLSLKIEPKDADEDDDLILKEIYSPTSTRMNMNKSFGGRNNLDMMNAFDYKCKSPGILKEEEEMVLNVIKALSSNSNSTSPISLKNNHNSMNIFNASFNHQANIADPKKDLHISGLKKTSYSELFQNDSAVLIDNNKTKCCQDNDKIDSTSANNINNNNLVNSIEPAIIDNNDDGKLVNLQNNFEKDSADDSSEYIKSCIQQSLKWVGKTDIQKYAKLIEDNFSDGTNEEINNIAKSISVNTDLLHSNGLTELTVIDEKQLIENNHRSDYIDNYNSELTEIIEKQCHQDNNCLPVKLENNNCTTTNNEKEEKDQFTTNKLNNNNCNGYHKAVINDIQEIKELQFELDKSHQNTNGSDKHILTDILPYFQEITNYENIENCTDHYPSVIEINTIDIPLNNTENCSTIQQVEYRKHSILMDDEIQLNSDKTKLQSTDDEDCKKVIKNEHSASSSSTSLKFQLKSLEHQLMKFENISIKPLNSIDKESETKLNGYDTFIDDPDGKCELSNNCNSWKSNPQAEVSTTNSLNLSQTVDEPPTMNSSQMFPLTQAVKMWLTNDKSSEPLLRIPNDPILSSFIKSSLTHQNRNDEEHSDDDDDDLWSITDDCCSLDKHNIDENDVDETTDELFQKNGTIKKDFKNSKNLKCNPLHVSSVKQPNHIKSIHLNTTTTIMDNDSDYNSDSQLRYDDDSTCERVANNLSDEEEQQILLMKSDLLDYWDDEFLENPQKCIIKSQLLSSTLVNGNDDDKNNAIKNHNNTTINNEIYRNFYRNNFNKPTMQIHQRHLSQNSDDTCSSSSGYPSTSSQTEYDYQYKSVYGESIDYEQLLASNFQFLSNNILSYNNNNNNNNNNSNNDNNEDMQNKRIILEKPLNNNNTNFDNNLNNNNININHKCPKPPELRCIIM